MRIIIAWLIRTALILGFNYIGWLTLLNGEGVPTKELNGVTIGAAALIAVVFTVSAYVLLLLTFGLAALLMVFLGGAVLALTAAVVPGYLDTNGFWLTCFAGFLLFVVAFATNKSKSKEDATTTS